MINFKKIDYDTIIDLLVLINIALYCVTRTYIVRDKFSRKEKKKKKHLMTWIGSCVELLLRYHSTRVKIISAERGITLSSGPLPFEQS
jgi:hypothetical protein